MAVFCDSTNPFGDPTNFTASIDWGDGTTTGGSVLSAGCENSASAFAVYPPSGGVHTYARASSFTISVSLSDGITSATATAALSVPLPPADVLSNPRLTLTHATVDVPVTGKIATFSDLDPSPVVSNFSAVIDWGDGTQSDGVVSNPFPGTLVVNAPPSGHSYASTGSLTVSVSLAEIEFGNASSTATGVVQVALQPAGGDVLSHPRLLLRQVPVHVPVTGVIAMFSDSNPSAAVSDFTAVIDWGDGTQSDGVVSSPSPGILEVSAPAGGHTYATRGMETLSASLSAPGVTASTATGAVSVGRHR